MLSWFGRGKVNGRSQKAREEKSQMKLSSQSSFKWMSAPTGYEEKGIRLLKRSMTKDNRRAELEQERKLEKYNASPNGGSRLSGHKADLMSDFIPAPQVEVEAEVKPKKYDEYSEKINFHIERNLLEVDGFIEQERLAEEAYQKKIEQEIPTEEIVLAAGIEERKPRMDYDDDIDTKLRFKYEREYYHSSGKAILDQIERNRSISDGMDDHFDDRDMEDDVELHISREIRRKLMLGKEVRNQEDIEGEYYSDVLQEKSEDTVEVVTKRTMHDAMKDDIPHAENATKKGTRKNIQTYPTQRSEMKLLAQYIAAFRSKMACNKSKIITKNVLVKNIPRKSIQTYPTQKSKKQQMIQFLRSLQSKRDFEEEEEEEEKEKVVWVEVKKSVKASVAKNIVVKKIARKNILTYPNRGSKVDIIGHYFNAMQNKKIGDIDKIISMGGNTTKTVGRKGIQTYPTRTCRKEQVMKSLRWLQSKRDFEDETVVVVKKEMKKEITTNLTAKKSMKKIIQTYPKKRSTMDLLSHYVNAMQGNKDGKTDKKGVRKNIQTYPTQKSKKQQMIQFLRSLQSKRDFEENEVTKKKINNTNNKINNIKNENKGRKIIHTYSKRRSSVLTLLLQPWLLLNLMKDCSADESNTKKNTNNNNINNKNMKKNNMKNKDSNSKNEVEVIGVRDTRKTSEKRNLLLENVKAAIIDRERARKEEERKEGTRKEGTRKDEEKKATDMQETRKRAQLAEMKAVIIAKEQMRKEEQARAIKQKRDLETVKIAIIEKEKSRKDREVEEQRKMQFEVTRTVIIEKERKRKEDETKSTLAQVVSIMQIRIVIEKKAPVIVVEEDEEEIVMVKGGKKQNTARKNAAQKIDEKIMVKECSSPAIPVEVVRHQSEEVKKVLELEQAKAVIIEKEQMRKEEQARAIKQKRDLETVKIAIIEKEKRRKDREVEEEQRNAAIEDERVRKEAVKKFLEMEEMKKIAACEEIRRAKEAKEIKQRMDLENVEIVIIEKEKKRKEEEEVRKRKEEELERKRKNEEEERKRKEIELERTRVEQMREMEKKNHTNNRIALEKVWDEEMKAQKNLEKLAALEADKQRMEQLCSLNKVTAKKSDTKKTIDEVVSVDDSSVLGVQMKRVQEVKHQSEEVKKVLELEQAKAVIIEKEQIRKEEEARAIKQKRDLETVKIAIIEKEKMRKMEEGKQITQKTDLAVVEAAIIEKERKRKEEEAEEDKEGNSSVGSTMGSDNKKSPPSPSKDKRRKQEDVEKMIKESVQRNQLQIARNAILEKEKMRKDEEKIQLGKETKNLVQSTVKFTTIMIEKALNAKEEKEIEIEKLKEKAASKNQKKQEEKIRNEDNKKNLLDRQNARILHTEKEKRKKEEVTKRFEDYQANFASRKVAETKFNPNRWR